MSYEVYTRQFTRMSEPMITLNARGRLVFNVAATKIIHDNAVQSVLLLWDSQSRKFAVRSMNKKDSRAFIVRFSGKESKWASISAKGFLVHIGHPVGTTKPYQAAWNDEQQMFEVDMAAQEREESTHDQERVALRRQALSSRPASAARQATTTR